MSQSSDSDIFSKRLKAARVYRDLTQGELADRTGLQPAAISHFETGERKPSFDNLRLLADKLDVSTDYLLGRVEGFKDLAGADKLHRHHHNLADADRRFVDDLITHLASKARAGGKDKK